MRSPKDKGHVEGTVGIISTWITAALRNRQFLSLRELNDAIRERLRAFNDKPFQRKDGCRALLFEEEKLFLASLPARRLKIGRAVGGNRFWIFIKVVYRDNRPY